MPLQTVSIKELSFQLERRQDEGRLCYKERVQVVGLRSAGKQGHYRSGASHLPYSGCEEEKGNSLQGPLTSERPSSLGPGGWGGKDNH